MCGGRRGPLWSRVTVCRWSGLVRPSQHRGPGTAPWAPGPRPAPGSGTFRQPRRLIQEQREGGELCWAGPGEGGCPPPPTFTLRGGRGSCWPSPRRPLDAAKPHASPARLARRTACLNSQGCHRVIKSETPPPHDVQRSHLHNTTKNKPLELRGGASPPSRRRGPWGSGGPGGRGPWGAARAGTRHLCRGVAWPRAQAGAGPAGHVDGQLAPAGAARRAPSLRCLSVRPGWGRSCSTPPGQPDRRPTRPGPSARPASTMRSGHRYSAHTRARGRGSCRDRTPGGLGDTAYWGQTSPPKS